MEHPKPPQASFTIDAKTIGKLLSRSKSSPPGLEIKVAFEPAEPAIWYEINHGDMRAKLNISKAEIQQAIYLNGQRYWRTWAKDEETYDKNQRQTPGWAFVVVVVVILCLFGLGWVFLGKTPKDGGDLMSSIVRPPPPGRLGV